MKSQTKAFLGLSLFLFGCAKEAPVQIRANTEIQKVNPTEVSTVLIPASKEAQRGCESALAAQGARILYKSETGMLMVDKEKSALSLSGCEAFAADNEPLELTRPESTGGDALPLPEIATLLRLIPSEEIGAISFVKANPTYDGRGAVVAILDTGVELDHPLLSKTTTGEDKVIDFEDFSGEGRVSLTATTLSNSKVDGTDFKVGTFKGSTLVEAEELSKKDKFKDLQVLSYLNPAGKRRLRVDTNADGSFDDEAELANYSEGRKFVKIGEKKSLTVSTNVSEDGTVATLCFDDGSHGTHVAGISTGYDPKGLRGVAPGAKVIAAKIGDNRLSGGSTTTASMLLAIDFAAKKKAHIVNMSYGIRSGSNLGKSAIDKYVDKVAAEKGILFSISAGNEGPGLLTVGTPAGSTLAITNAAYISRQTARDNYGYAGVEDDNTWFFSSVGPRLDGGWKPTLLAPGSALASVPKWKGFWANYRGTSMASPQTTGGLALLVSGAQQAKLPVDRVSITRAVYAGAKVQSNLLFIEQGHGLMSVPQAFTALSRMKDILPIEYAIGVTSSTTPDGKGAGIYTRSRTLPENAFTVTVLPKFPEGTSEEVKNDLKTFKLVASHPWIKPVPYLYVTSEAKTFQVEINQAILQKHGVNSGRIQAVDEKTGEVAFEVPVTIVSPYLTNDVNSYKVDFTDRIKVGQTLRYFIDVPKGATSILLDLESDGPIVWGQLLDPEGRLITQLRDSEVSVPQPLLQAQGKISRAGVYEIDLVAPAYNKKPAKVTLKAQLFSLSSSVSTATGLNKYDISVQNDFAALKFVPRLQLRGTASASVVEVKGNAVKVPFNVSKEDAENFSKIAFTVETSQKTYDLMTDYPYRVFDSEGKVAASGGLELNSEIALEEFEDLIKGQNQLEVQGAFTEKAPDSWFFKLTERRLLKTPVNVFKGNRILVETGQTAVISVDLTEAKKSPKEIARCPILILENPNGRTIQEEELCF